MSHKINTTLTDLKHITYERRACKPWGAHETSAMKEYVEMLEAEVAALREHVHWLSAGLAAMIHVATIEAVALHGSNSHEGQVKGMAQDNNGSLAGRTRWMAWSI